FRGVECAIGTHLSFGERLGAIAESVRQRVASSVDDFELLVLSDEHKLDFSGSTLYRILLNVPSYAQPLLRGFRAQLPDFGDGFIVALGLPDPGRGQPDQGAEDDDNKGRKSAIFFHSRLVSFSIPPGNWIVAVWHAIQSRFGMRPLQASILDPTLAEPRRPLREKRRSSGSYRGG